MWLLRKYLKHNFSTRMRLHLWREVNSANNLHFKADGGARSSTYKRLFPHHLCCSLPQRLFIFGRCNYTTLCDDTFPRTLDNWRSIAGKKCYQILNWRLYSPLQRNSPRKYSKRCSSSVPALIEKTFRRTFYLFTCLTINLQQDVTWPVQFCRVTSSFQRNNTRKVATSIKKKHKKS